MNLWVKRTGQLLLAALFLLACEDEESLLGFRSPRKRFDVSYIDFAIGQGSVLSLPSVTSDNLTNPARYLIGEYTDPVVGTVKSVAYGEYFPSVISLLNETSVYDSIELILRLDTYAYGLSIQREERFTIHRITEDTITYFGGNRYYSDSQLGYDPTPIGEARYIVNPDTLKKNQGLTAAQRDTLVARAKLDDAFGLELFDLAKNNPDDKYTKLNLFRATVKGLVMVPSQSNSIIGFDFNNALSKIVLHYHTMESGSVKDTLKLNFNYSFNSFNNISVTPSGEWANITQPNQGIDPPSGLRYIQSGSPFITRLDLNTFYTQFADTIQSPVLINAAEILIESVQSPNGFEPISFLEFRTMKNDDTFYRKDIPSDSLAMLNYRLIASQNNFLPLSDAGSEAASLIYNSGSKLYRGFITQFVQDLHNKRDAQDRIRYIGLYPATSQTGLNPPNFGKVVNRTIFHKDNIKLRVYYTRITGTQ